MFARGLGVALFLGQVFGARCLVGLFVVFVFRLLGDRFVACVCGSGPLSVVRCFGCFPCLFFGIFLWLKWRWGPPFDGHTGDGFSRGPFPTGSG